MDSESIQKPVHWYSHTEEQLNIYSHALGALLSIVATYMLIVKSFEYSIYQGASLVIFGLSQILIFSASTIYHAQKDNQKRYFWNIVDHAMIYVSIAGTYTPICIITLSNSHGIWLFNFVWACASIGMLLKIKFTGKYNILSTIMYLAMGWIIIFYWKDVKLNMEDTGVNFIIAGGISYTIGAIFYIIKQIKFNHAIFHLFILIGAICHFLAIYNYIK